MRQVNQKRSRGGRSGGRKPHQMGGQRNFDSNGPDVKIRGTAAHIFDRYCQLARDANAGGDRIGAENYLQHAEHYYRIMVANGAFNQRMNGQQQPQHGQQPMQQPTVSLDGEQHDEAEYSPTPDPAGV
jgi:hypothetical protein